MSEAAAAESGAEVTAPAPDPAEVKAREAGWKPKEEFDGDVSAWVDAGEFLRRAPLYDTNKSLKREIKELRTTLHEMKGHIGKVAEVTRQRTIAELEAKRDEAIDLGDREQVREIDKAIKDAEKPVVAQTQDVHPSIKEWEERNGKWFYADKKVSTFGYSLMQGLLAENGGDIDSALVDMEAACKKAFPEKFENPKRSAPAAVEGGGSPAAKRGPTEADLTDEQRRVMNKFIRTAGISKEAYIKDLAESGLIGGKK